MIGNLLFHSLFPLLRLSLFNHPPRLPLPVFRFSFHHLYLTPLIVSPRQKGTVLYNVAAGMCLGATDRREMAPLVMEMCKAGELVEWDLEEVS